IFTVAQSRDHGSWPRSYRDREHRLLQYLRWGLQRRQFRVFTYRQHGAGLEYKPECDRYLGTKRWRRHLAKHAAGHRELFGFHKDLNGGPEMDDDEITVRIEGEDDDGAVASSSSRSVDELNKQANRDRAFTARTKFQTAHLRREAALRE